MEPQIDNPTQPTAVHFDEQSFWVSLADGRVLGVPLLWYPRLLAATAAQRNAVEFSSRGLHWDDIDEDISVAGLLAGGKDLTKRRLASSNPTA